MKLKINDQIPDTEIFHLVDGEPQTINIREILGDSKIILFGLPGAFTSTCSKLHLPGYVANAEKIKTKGIDKIFCISVNDPHVMNAWGEANNVGNNITMIADPYLLFLILCHSVLYGKSCYLNDHEHFERQNSTNRKNNFEAFQISVGKIFRRCYGETKQ